MAKEITGDILFEQTASCTRCGSCLAVCPSYLATGNESMSPRGRTELARAMADGDLGLTRGLEERLSGCLGCLACAAACPGGVDPPEVIREVRGRLVREKGSRRLLRAAVKRMAGAGGDPPAWLRIAAKLEDLLYRRLPPGSYLPFYEEGRKRRLPAVAPPSVSRALPRSSPAKGASSRVAFFPGCSSRLFFPQSGLAAIMALNRAGADVTVPEGLGCCGMPMVSLGDDEAARPLALRNLTVLDSLDADFIVTICPSCALALKQEIPRLLGTRPPAVDGMISRVRDIHSFLAERQAAFGKPSRWTGRSPGGPQGKKKDITVTWHDPCHLKHGLGITVEPREIICSLAGVRYVESATDRSCCGAAGPFSLLHYDLSLKVGRQMAERIASSGADIVATGCPACRVQLADLLRRAGAGTAVVHTVDLLGGAASAGNNS